MHQPPPSPTNSSLSSSDLDTESTGSFFHDRSTTLGTLMGVTFPAITATFRAPSHGRDSAAETSDLATENSVVNPTRNNKKAELLLLRRRRKWWRLCSDASAKPASLREFLEMERRFGDTAVELEGMMVTPPGQQQQEGNRALFAADGRVLPPPRHSDVGPVGVEGESTAGSLCTFPVSFSGICSGCVA